MDTLEKELKEYILSKYRTISQFCEKTDMSWTTLDSIFKRGIKNSSISNVIKICSELGIDCESLYYGKIVFKENRLNISTDDKSELSPTEKQVIVEYRKADDVTKEMVHRVLHIEEKKDSEKMA